MITKPTVVPVGVVRINVYRAIADAVERGAAYAARRCFKYTNTPTQQTITDECEQSIMLELRELLDFGNDDE